MITDFLHNTIFQDQTFSLRNLHLQDNLLNHIPNAIQEVRYLKHLNIQNNKLSSLSGIDIKTLDICKEAQIKMSGNPFECSCKNLHMIRWFESNKNRIEDLDDIYCIGGVYLLNITKQMREFELSCLSTFWLEFSASLCICVTLAIIFAAICYRYRVFIQYLYLILVSSRPKPSELNDKYDYDVFISYSNKDYDGVIHTLYKRLTEEFNMNVCIHDKDFVPGRSIANEILRCIDHSRKVVFVVTRNFLEIDWGNYELELARIHAFRSERCGLLIILKDELLIKEMPELLKKMWWKIVCLKWPNGDNCGDSEELFWHNLKLSLAE